MVSRSDIVTTALDWIGTPFRHQGRSRSGVDCVGLVICVGRELGMPEADNDSPVNYRRNADGVDLLKEFRRHMGKEKRIDLTKPGDVFLFRDRQFVIHTGIVTAVSPRVQVVHAYAPNRQVIKCYPEDTRDNQGRLSDRVQFCFEYPGVED